MEGGRQSEIAKAILGSKNVPYVVAAPLLIQVGLMGCITCVFVSLTEHGCCSRYSGCRDGCC
jgi:hypothetical protein